jgi:hypothetical protein
MELGVQFSDNTSKVQKYTPGQVVNIVLDIENHHPVGYAVRLNVVLLRFLNLEALSPRMCLW